MNLEPRAQVGFVFEAEDGLGVEEIVAGAELVGECVADRDIEARVRAALPLQSQLDARLLEKEPAVLRQAGNVEGVALNLVRAIDIEILRENVANVSGQVRQQGIAAADLEVF